MVVRIKKKRRRGERTYHGSHKKRRGKGSKGGSGKAGLHKHKWTYTVKYEPKHFGKRGFKSVKKKYYEEKAINIGELNELISRLEKDNKLNLENEKIKINLKDLGYDKILGRGEINKAIIVEVKKISKIARNKIEEKGGEIKLVK
jgi:large subunit ribosomal protein L15